MRKLFFFAIVMIAFCQMAFSQIEVNSTGQVGIGVAPNSNYRLYVGNGNTLLDEYLGCIIPKTISKVQLCVYNMQGVQIKCLNIDERGEVEVMIEAGALTSGIYTYLLIGDWKTSEAKNMILTK